jgi:outer membrane protein assembly factor BamA
MIPFFTNIKNISRYVIYTISILLVLASCNTKKFLKEDEILLKSNNIVFEANEKVLKKRSLKKELETIYKQRPNSKRIGLIKSNLWFYYRTDSLENPSKFQKWIRRKIAEPPALYTDEIAATTAKSMKFYLQNKGFYFAEVSYDKTINKRKKLASVTYKVTTKNLYTIDSVFFNSTDPKIQRILNDSEDDTFLKKDQPVSQELYNKEVDRITTTLKNLGFAYFDRNFVDNLTGDSTGTKVNIYLNILNPRNQTEHKVYRVGKISVNPRYIPSELLKPKQDSIINGINFLLDEYGTIVNPKSIIREIFLKEGELYKEENYTKTNRQLGRLDIYKFISIKSKIDEIEDDKINFEIRLTPKKRNVIGGDLELNNSNYVSQVTNNTSLIGLGINLNYQNRNFRKNASILELKANNSMEFNIGETQTPIFSLDILTQADWYIPKLVQFPKLYSFLNRVNIIKDNSFQDFTENAETRVSASYNRLSLFDFYNYHSFNMSFGYDFQRDNYNRFTWTQTAVNYLLPQFEPAFDTIRASNPYIARSFTEQLFTGFLFRDFKFSHTGKPNPFGNAWKFQGDFELSGGEVFLTNWIYNGFNKDYTFKFLNVVEYAQYARLNLDFRRYIGVGKKGVFAYKAAFGFARPFGFSENVPYVKQFYGGGPFGNRAWRIRELGPGGYFDENASTEIFFQTGDLKLDFNMEIRFNVFGGLNGALFLDIGNVWSVDFDEDRPGSQFLLKADPDIPGTDSFYKQFGVGTGVGIRYDFSYFILGVDFGIKARNPYSDSEGRNWLIYKWDKLQLRDINPNLLIGFPF